MPRSIFARLLLIFALLFAQTGGLLHEISHQVANQSQDHSLPHSKHCDQCAAYAQLGAALGSHVIQFTSVEQRTALSDTAFDNTGSAAEFAAYTPRAPPYSA